MDLQRNVRWKIHVHHRRFAGQEAPTNRLPRPASMEFRMTMTTMTTMTTNDDAFALPSSGSSFLSASASRISETNDDDDDDDSHNFASR